MRLKWRIGIGLKQLVYQVAHRRQSLMAPKQSRDLRDNGGPGNLPEDHIRQLNGVDKYTGNNGNTYTQRYLGQHRNQRTGRRDNMGIESPAPGHLAQAKHLLGDDKRLAGRA
ncbi:hypothetical protein EDC52_104263 [Biostraticola tofi]|uniref:Uncharacterized protein n=1 Tax=Biostraticola tofi TaxID=466109 RepID=A0A4R3YZI6_9GAMM|nr:hypothetical protein EDC52_104263 [Biostraticola tofi]